MGDLSGEKLDWEALGREQVAAMSEAELRDYVSVLDEKVARLCMAVHYLNNFGIHGNPNGIKDMLDPPDPSKPFDEAVYPAGG
jgi:hypothetical protein